MKNVHDKILVHKIMVEVGHSAEIYTGPGLF